MDDESPDGDVVNELELPFPVLPVPFAYKRELSFELGIEPWNKKKQFCSFNSP